MMPHFISDTTTLDRIALIHCKRLILRQPVDDDMQAVFDIHADPETNRFNPNGPMASRDIAESTLGRWLEHWRETGFGYWAVCRHEDPNTVIGFGGLINKTIDDTPGLNLYFRFRPSAWGYGYANEMAIAAFDVAFKVLRRESVCGLVRPSNMPSRKALERLGMIVARTIDDIPDREPSLLYEMTRERFLARQEEA